MVFGPNRESFVIKTPFVCGIIEKEMDDVIRNCPLYVFLVENEDV